MANHTDDETDRRVPSRPPAKRSRGGWVGWVLFLLAIGVGVGLYYLLHLPLQRDRARLAREAREARSEADHASGRLSVIEPTVETLTTERDALRAARDRLVDESGELASTLEVREAELARLRSTRESLEEQLRAEIDGGDIWIREVDGEIRVRLADQILFAPGSADLSGRGQAVLRRVASSLASLEGHVVEVGGHTDDTPLSETTAAVFPTNWELSTARATHVVRFLEDECAIPGNRLVAAGYSQHRPATLEATAAGRRRNRRIELTLRPRTAADEADAAPAAAAP